MNNSTPQTSFKHPLTRKTNDSHSRTIQYKKHENNIHQITQLENHSPSNKKRSSSIYQFDLLHQPIQNLINHSSKKIKSSSSSKDLSPVQLSSLKLIPKDTPPNRNQIHLNLASNLKPIFKKQSIERPPSVNLRQHTSWESIPPVLRPIASTRTLKTDGSTHQSSHTRILKPPKPLVPTSVTRSNQSHLITSPLNAICNLNKQVADRPIIDLRLTNLGPNLCGTKLNQSIRPIHSSSFLPIPTALSYKQVAPPTVSPPNNQRKKRNILSSQLFDRAKKIIESDQSSLRIWQSDMEVGASLRGTRTRKFEILKFIKDHGTQTVHCKEIHHTSKRDQLDERQDQRDQGQNENQSIWKIFLRGDEPKEGDRIKIFFPWTEINEKNLIISNRYIILQG